MSCKHGNWDSCDECKAEDDLWDRAYKAGYEEGGKVSIDLTLKHLKRAEQAESRNKRLVELLKDPTQAMVDAGTQALSAEFLNADPHYIFTAMSSELLREVDNGQ